VLLIPDRYLVHDKHPEGLELTLPPGQPTSAYLAASADHHPSAIVGFISASRSQYVGRADGAVRGTRATTLCPVQKLRVLAQAPAGL